MGLFDRTAKHLAAGPTMLVPADRVDAVTELVHRYDPNVKVKGDGFFFDNGVFLYGPVEAPIPEMVGYYVRPAWLPKKQDRPEYEKLLDGERLLRGLTVRLHGQMQSRQPWADLELAVSVYAERELPVEQVIAVLQPYAGTEDGQRLEAKKYEVEGGYVLLSQEQPVLRALFAPAWVSRLPSFRPSLAVGARWTGDLCRWELGSMSPSATAARAQCWLLASAGLALATAANGAVVDMFGFPIAAPDELLPA